MSKIGFFGGSFNPPTNAHINLVKQVINEFNLDKVIFMPVNDLYEKQGLEKGIHRLNMLKLVCEDNEKLDYSDVELKINKRIYAIDVFKLVEKTYPNDDIYYIMGSDNFNKIHTWRDSKYLLKKFKYIILKRDNKIIYNIEKALNVQILKNNPNMISSTKARDKLRIRENRDIQNLIPLKVQKYIEENKLYI